MIMRSLIGQDRLAAAPWLISKQRRQLGIVLIFFGCGIGGAKRDQPLTSSLRIQDVTLDGEIPDDFEWASHPCIYSGLRSSEQYRVTWSGLP